MIQSVARDLLLVLAATLLLVFAVAWALRPLARLRSEVAARSDQDMTPISTHGVPSDVQPLVLAINEHVERNRLQTEARRRFVDDASHQLRTPLATLATQVGFALRQTDAEDLRQTVVAIKAQLDETVRQTNQMLALARAESVALTAESVDAGGLLKEALSNLLHNAIRYTPPGGQVTLQVARLGQGVTIAVIDNGPGIPAAELEHAGDRFFRGSNIDQPGSGLGLAIVRSIVERLHGSLLLAAGPQGRGLAVTLSLPLAVDAKKDQG